MSGGNPGTQMHRSPVGEHPRSCGQARVRNHAWQRLNSKPPAVVLLGLALAVTFWVSASRISRSGADSSQVRIPAAKLWIEHRFGFAEVTSAVTAPTVNERFYAQSGAGALLAQAPQLYLKAVPGALPVFARPRAIPFFHSAIPLRSPPSLLSL